MISLPFCAEDVVNILASDGKQSLLFQNICCSLICFRSFSFDKNLGSGEDESHNLLQLLLLLLSFPLLLLLLLLQSFI